MALVGVAVEASTLLELSPLLLSAPIAALAARKIAKSERFGIVLGFRGVIPYVLPIEPGHIAIYGMTGSGKTNTAKLICSKCSKRIPVLVLDWSGEYRLPGFEALIPGDNFSLNPLDIYAGSMSDHTEFLVDLFGEVFEFTEPQKFMLRCALKEAYRCYDEPTLLDLAEVLERLPPRSYYDHETKMAIKRRISHLTEGRAARALGPSSVDVDRLFNSRAAVDLSAFRSVHARKLLAAILLKVLYDYAESRRRFSKRVVHLTVIEEAWNVIPYRRLDRSPLIGERLFAELRKYGESLIAVSQSPYETSWSIARNARTIILHRMLSRDLEVLGLRREFEEVLPRLKTGEAVVVRNGKVAKIRIPRVGLGEVGGERCEEYVEVLLD